MMSYLAILPIRPSEHDRSRFGKDSR